MKLFVSFFALALSLFVVPAKMPAQVSTPSHRGVTEDWSNHHLVFSREALLRNPDLLYKEPRVLQQAMQRWQAPNDSGRFLPRANMAAVVKKIDAAGSNRDWNVSLSKSHIAPDMYPAKYSFDASAAPSCANDFVVMGLLFTGVTGGQANLVGFNNLYSGAGGICSGPSVLFAYNVSPFGGKVTTSPVLSLDGTKIAFVESVSGSQAIFHVLTWAAGQGSINAAAAPTMTSLPFSITAGNTISSPWVDYSSDTAYVGSDNGIIYQITGVFQSTPVLTNSWTITSGNFRLSPPVLDSSRNLLLVGSGNGNLYSLDITTGATQSHPIGATGKLYAGVATSPIIDVTSGTTFAVSADDGTSEVLVQVQTSNVGSQQESRARIGVTATTAQTVALSVPDPALSNSYFNDPASGNIRLCGTGTANNSNDLSPWEYSFGFTGTTLNTTISYTNQLSTSVTARCTPWAEFYNPNIGGGTDFFFFGLTSDCTGAGYAGGCVISRGKNNLLVKATINGGPSGITADNWSTSPQAHSIYFSSTRVNTAYKFTQDTLQ